MKTVKKTANNQQENAYAEYVSTGNDCRNVRWTRKTVVIVTLQAQLTLRR